MLIGIYIRVSTDEQASEGYSLAEQERQCRAYCSGITRFTPAPAYAVLVEAAARVIEGCPTGDEYASITLPPRVYTV